MNSKIENECLYIVKYQDFEESLCYFEMKQIFGKYISNNYFFSSTLIDPSRSPFIKHRLKILFTAQTLESLCQKLQSNSVSYRKYKYTYFNINTEMKFTDWNNAINSLRDSIIGDMDFNQPDIFLGLIQIKEKWYFGEYCKNDTSWKYHDYKPNTNSHSLGIKLARALVNIAVGQNSHFKIIDPCCGVGTVIIEAVSLGLDIQGYEINWKIAEKAKENLTFFGIGSLITHGDMHAITEHYDVAIVDIPYGLFTKVVLESQIQIIKTSRKIANKLVIVTFGNMDIELLDEGFTIIDQCQVKKGQFTRYISICE